jgi:hypothetical protein
MGSLEAMAKGSEARYLSDTQNLKIAQVGLARGFRDPYTCWPRPSSLCVSGTCRVVPGHCMQSAFATHLAD